MEQKKVAIVAEWMTSRGGAEKVVLELARIFPKADIFTTVYNQKIFPELKNRRVKTSFLQKVPYFNHHHQLLLPLLPKAIESLNLAPYDLIISSSSAVGKGIKKPKRSVHVCYCHTPMRWVWQTDLDRRLIRLPFGKAMIGWLKKWDLKTNQGVDLFLCNSNFTKQRIKDFYKIDAKVIYPPAISKDDVDLKEETKNSRGDFYFAISRLVPYKRFDLAIDACNLLQKNLIIAGAGPDEKHLKRIAGRTVTFVGRSDEEMKKKLFQTCKAVIFPSEEDLGIVPIEAQAAGAPVVAYSKGGTRETVIDTKTGALFGKQEIKSIIEAIERLEKSDFSEREIKENSLKFTKEKFEEEILEIIKNL